MRVDFLTETDARLKIYKTNKVSIQNLRRWAKQNTVNKYFYNLIAFELELIKEIYIKSHFNTSVISLNRIFPYGYVMNENECYINIPKEYEKFNNDKMAFLLSVLPSNRNIWYLLSLQDKYEFYDFLMSHSDYKLKHMNSPYYTCGNLAEEILRFAVDDSISTFAEYYQDRKNNKRIIDDKFVEPTDNPLLQESLLPFEICKFENFKIKHEGKDFKFYRYVKIDTKNTPRVHTGQYIASLECKRR